MGVVCNECRACIENNRRNNNSNNANRNNNITPISSSNRGNSGQNNGYKFICVIRHNQSLDEPIFYHINLQKEPNSDNYIYYKDDKENESIGSEQIKERISKINQEE